MHGFWKRKLPAFLLALVLVTSLIPAAAAAEPCPDGSITGEPGLLHLRPLAIKKENRHIPARPAELPRTRLFMRPVFTITKRPVILRPAARMVN